jgi:hypothetical protein
MMFYFARYYNYVCLFILLLKFLIMSLMNLLNYDALLKSYIRMSISSRWRGMQCTWGGFVAAVLEPGGWIRS